MDELVAVASPVWLLVAGVAGLALAFFALGWAACYALGVGRRLEEYEQHSAYAPNVAREVRRLDRKIDEHLEEEHSGPVAVRSPRPIRA